MNVSVFSSELLVKHLFTNATSPTRPTSWFVALHSGAPSLNGSDNEITDANYARQAVTFAATQPVAAGVWQASSIADVVFPASAAEFTVTHVTVFDSATAGTALGVFALPLARTVAAAGVFSIPINELVITGE